ncbi:599_t:CDS:2 [Dentiscutata erythropus]|uniref:599_t:CDS:1 n=1 Tax=Dentiscutata erythropus TaxID=1348616 RepID=A0A9N9ERL5_9GLOM|nr:599_t:CDS:2 [Dentiscutata erythropus]
MTNPKTNHINKDHLKNATIKPRNRDLVKCNCIWHCEGGRWVDPRTQANKSVRSSAKEQKYRSGLVKLNLSGDDFSNQFFEDDIVANLDETELKELELDKNILTDNSQKSSNFDYDDDLEGT